MIEISGKHGEKVVINISRRLSPDATLHHEIDFLEAFIKLSFLEFTAQFRFFVRSSEIEYWVRQKDELRMLGKQLRLSTLEENIVINLHINTSAEAIWDFELKGRENQDKLFLKLVSESTEIDHFMHQLQKVLALYPIPAYQ